MGEAIKYQWLVEKRVMLLVLDGEVKTHDLLDFDRDMLMFLDSTTQPVFFLSDIQNMVKLPGISDFLKLKSLRHPHLGTVVMIGGVQNGIANFIMRVLTTTVRMGYKNVSTLAEAQQHVLMVDPTLAPAEAWNIML